MSDIQEYIKREMSNIKDSDLFGGLQILQNNLKGAERMKREDMDFLLSDSALQDTPIESIAPDASNGQAPVELEQQRKIVERLRQNSQKSPILPQEVLQSRENNRKKHELSELQREIFGSSDEDARLAAEAIAEHKNAINVGEIASEPNISNENLGIKTRKEELGIYSDDMCEFDDII